MAEKEERIVCRVIENGYGCDYCLPTPGYQYRQCSISNYDCMYDRYGQCSLGMTRQEAIERMAKEMARLYCPEKPTKKEFESIWEYELLLSTQKHFKELAQAALNSLLEADK